MKTILVLFINIDPVSDIVLNKYLLKNGIKEN